MLDNLLAFIVIGSVLIAIVFIESFSINKGDKACRVYSFITFADGFFIASIKVILLPTY
jgi:hypothetical protein